MIEAFFGVFCLMIVGSESSIPELAAEDSALFLDDEMDIVEETAKGDVNTSDGSWLHFLDYGDVDSPDAARSAAARDRLRKITSGNQHMEIEEEEDKADQRQRRDYNDDDDDDDDDNDNEKDNEVEEESNPEVEKTNKIEQSFHHTTPVHPDKPGLVAECVWEVLPDELCCCFDFGLVVCLCHDYIMLFSE